MSDYDDTLLKMFFEVYDTKWKGKLRALTRMYEQLAMEDIKVGNDIFSGKLSHFNEMVQKDYTRLLEMKLRPKKFFWITINPKPEVTILQLSDKVSKAVSKRWIREYAYVYEVRHSDYSGLHVHILAESWTTKCPADVKREMLSTFKKLVGQPQSVDVKDFPYAGPYYKDKLQYLRGDKWDPKKDDAIKYTRQWRIENNIPELYQAKNDTLCVAEGWSSEGVI